VDSRFDDFMRKISKAQSLEQIDKRAEDFIQGNNWTQTKMPRKRVAKIICNVSKTNSANLQLLPALARFIATVNQYFPEISSEMGQFLSSEFAELSSSETTDFNYDVKIRNIRFQGELAKFGIYPAEKIMEHMKVCLANFHGHNIEIVCNLLESCGRYLLNSLQPA
jgi:regulator of nonsense transcripts 2